MIEYKCAFFDFDGVIVDSEKIRLNTYKKLFFELYEINIEVCESMIGKSEQSNLKNILNKNQLQFDNKTLDYLIKARSKILISEAEKGFQGVSIILQIINWLKLKGFPMAIVTNSSYDYLSAALKNLKLDKENFYLSTAEKISLPKPNPEIYIQTLGNFNFNSNEVLVFEDSPSGLNSAQAAGLDTVAVQSSFDKSILKSKYHLKLDDDTKKIFSLFGDYNA